MVTRRLREEFMSRNSSIPYSRIFGALKSAWHICQSDRKDRDVQPNRFVLFFSPVDRKVRDKYEDIFIDEITRDILHLQVKTHSRRLSTTIAVEIRTDARFGPGRMRIECYQDDRLLYRFEQEEDVEYSVDQEEGEREWTAVDILPKENVLGKCILVVDDEPVLCAVLQRMLTKLDYHVVSAHDGVEATKILSHMPVDLVITDLRMPRMDGWGLMQYVKKNMPRVPVILITGYHSMHTEARASDSSADGYISKPFSMSQIKALLESVLAERENANKAITYISDGTGGI